MEIVAADPKASALTEAEVRTLLAEPLLMRLGMVDADGWPLVHPVWHVFEGERSVGCERGDLLLFAPEARHD